ncbi:mannosyl-oligosaccharide alpha-1,2-mannosidase [Mucor velutinosus]|uniref:Mannosyl-oligosaccharide alpha-1,2-mannosidase n=1 Tax=Mucor velutinosus TaxID=708070 RepID=A0AAN7D6R5_9FUNG|nr:mannosyl-oligosaccharide alpha-1,2-mannosidase [Mucor velutinosus]
MMLATFLLVSLAAMSAIAEQPYIRYNSGCQLLLNNTRIYCYSGGYAKVVNQEITPLADHYYLDVSKDLTVASSLTSWTKVVDPPNFITEATSAYVSVKLSDTAVLINGGTGVNNNYNYMKNQTVIYHADTNQWETISNTSSIPQNYYGSGALGVDNTVVFWGGAAIIGNLLPTFNGTAKLSITAQTAKWSLQAASVAPGNPRYGHTATTDQSGKLIYYFGGRDIVRDPATGVYTRPYSTFTNVLIYHTDTSIWEQKTATSSSPPSNRMSHTATLIPSTGNFIIYGGAGPDSVGNRIPISDYLHLYNPTANTFQPISISSGAATGAGPRFGHSAVLRNASLFILFGIDSTLLATADFHVLNTDTYSWDATYYANGAVSSIDGVNGNGTSTGGNSTTTGGSSSSDKMQDTVSNGLSGGAIAGIVVGIIAVIALIAGFLFFRRQKQKKAEKDTYPTYWDVTSINEITAASGISKHDMDVQSIPVTSTGPVDITQLPGYTTCRTGDPANLSNDHDINPPASPPKVLLTGVNHASGNAGSSRADSSSTYVTTDHSKVWPPDVHVPSIVTPSTPIDSEKPDIGHSK